MVLAKSILSSKDQFKNDALNVALNIGLLTRDKLKFSSTKLGIKGERSLDKNVQRFKLFDTKSKQVIFNLILQTGAPVKIIEFRRGVWEGLLDLYAKEGSKDSKSRLRLRERVKRITKRTP